MAGGSQNTSAYRDVDVALPDLGEDFVSETASVNDTVIHYVRGGHGPTVVLIHGFPQDWYEWRRIMPRLAKRFTVVAVDLRGVGGSAPSASHYAATELASDIRHLLDQLGLGAAHLVGHDIGGSVAYAFARAFPEWTSTAIIIEAPIPGIEPRFDLAIEAPMWHVAFHMTPDLPEVLVAGRQAVYFRYFFDEFTQEDDVISDADVQHYAHAYRDPDHLPAAFEFYRAMPANMSYNAEQKCPTDIPLLLVGGEHLFGPMFPRLAANLRANYGWENVQTHMVKGAKHYLPEEKPNDIAELIERHTAGAEPS
ncbi:alpha/beta fold hydrolase [uncultured Mycobacterium sp.]|uniref:alpha/beta fold hydrolase n=1 Tax=uncultured Mycobacterium sp. TaxID=171292 RepID=UPI0035CB4B57